MKDRIRAFFAIVIVLGSCALSFIESAQQEFVDKARGIERGVWNLGTMYVDGMLDKGRKVIEAEVKRYI